MKKLKQANFHQPRDFGSSIDDNYKNEHDHHEHVHDDCDECNEGGVSCSCCSSSGGHDHKTENKYITYGVLGVSVISLILGYMNINIFGINVSLAATVLCGVPIAIDAVKSLINGFKITTNLLITIAIIAAVAIGELFAAAEVAFIMTLGEMLEEYTLKKANKGLSTLISYAPKIAHLLNGKDVNAKDLKVGDVVLIKNGESVPVDGIIIEGESNIDQSMVTGESEPVHKSADDMVYEGTVNGEGALTVKATHSGKDSTLSRMIALVKRAQNEKANTVKITDKIAGYIVPISVLTSIGVYIFTGEVVRAVTILVVFCPCSLVLSMPTAIMACIGRATKMGVLIKSGQAIENLWSADTVITDKTGTLTHGKMNVSAVIGDMQQVVSAAAMAESMSSHPIAKAVITYAKEQNIKPQKGESFKNISGKGIVCGDVAVGNDKLLKELNISCENSLMEKIANAEKDGSKALYVSKGGKLIGAVTVKDTIRNSAKTAVAKMKDMGITVVMATGDKKHIADTVGSSVGVNEVRADLLPEDKVSLVDELHNMGRKVIMVGDGVNDAPALAKANVGIAMGAIGSDVAIETADVALMNDEIANVPKTVALAKKTKITVSVNIFASIALSLFAVIFAGTGDIGPVAGALIHNLGAIVVVLNSIWLFYKKV